MGLWSFDTLGADGNRACDGLGGSGIVHRSCRLGTMPLGHCDRTVGDSFRDDLGGIAWPKCDRYRRRIGE